jgi:hypothetical protein
MELESLLAQATQRDGQVLYDFGDPDLPSIREGKVQKADFEAFRLGPDSGAAARDNSDEHNQLVQAMAEYRLWIGRRSEDLDEQYDSMKRDVEVRRDRRTDLR